MIGIRSPNHRFDASDWAFAYAIVLLTIPVCLSLVRLVGIWTCPESHIRTLFRSHAQSCCSGRHVSHQKPIAKRYPSTKSNQHYLETVKKSNAETHCGRKCMFIKNFIPISQYPNIPISQYNFISGYNFPNIPISQYPNIPIYIGILGYRDIPTRNNCSRRPAPTHMPSRPLVIGPPAHTVHRTAHSAWHVFSCPQGTKTHAKQNALCGGQYGPEAQ